MGAVQFSAQYQQNPHIEKEWRIGTHFAKEYDDAWYENWKPEDGIESADWTPLPESWFLAHELLLEEIPPPKSLVPRLTEEQWEAALMLHQRKLVESVFRPDYRHPSDRREDE